MQIKHLRIFQLHIYSHKTNTFARIFFITFRISCQKMLAALVISIQLSVQSSAFSCWLRSIPITFSHSRYSEFNSVDELCHRLYYIILNYSPLYNLWLCPYHIPSLLHSRLSHKLSIFKYYLAHGKKDDYASIW